MSTPTPNEEETAVVTPQSVTITEHNPFQPSRKTRRSPQTGSRSTLHTNRSAPPKSKTIVRDKHQSEETPRSTHDKTIPIAEAKQADTTAPISSPRQEFIIKMRNSEEETVGKCRDVLKRIREAISRQRQISMEVQNGVAELEELLDILGDYRRNWKSAEAERERSKEQTEHTWLPPTESPKMHCDKPCR